MVEGLMLDLRILTTSPSFRDVCAEDATQTVL